MTYVNFVVLGHAFENIPDSRQLQESIVEELAIPIMTKVKMTKIIRIKAE